MLDFEQKTSKKGERKPENKKNARLDSLRSNLAEIEAGSLSGAESVPQVNSKGQDTVEKSEQQRLLGSQLRFNAMNLLARRDHSRFELENKLNNKKQAILRRVLKELKKSSVSLSQPFLQSEGMGVGEAPEETLLAALSETFDSELIAVLDVLEQEKLLDDQRFAEAYIRWRANAGFGPIRIRNDLSNKGVSVSSGLLGSVDWAERVRQARVKKFGGAAPADFSEKARQMRFLAYRGFSNELIGVCFD